MRLSARLALVALLTLALPVARADAQPTPTDAPHPEMPWDTATRGTKQFVRQWAVPERALTLPVPVAVPAPAEEPEAEGPLLQGPAPAAEAKEPEQRGVQMRTFRVPGYTITETRYGYHYPPRWMLVETSPGEYSWQFLPEAFVPRR